MSLHNHRDPLIEGGRDAFVDGDRMNFRPIDDWTKKHCYGAGINPAHLSFNNELVPFDEDSFAAGRNPNQEPKRSDGWGTISIALGPYMTQEAIVDQETVGDPADQWLQANAEIVERNPNLETIEQIADIEESDQVRRERLRLDEERAWKGKGWKPERRTNPHTGQQYHLRVAIENWIGEYEFRTAGRRPAIVDIAKVEQAWIAMKDRAIQEEEKSVKVTLIATDNKGNVIDAQIQGKNEPTLPYTLTLKRGESVRVRVYMVGFVGEVVEVGSDMTEVKVMLRQKPAFVDLSHLSRLSNRATGKVGGDKELRLRKAVAARLGEEKAGSIKPHMLEACLRNLQIETQR